MTTRDNSNVMPIIPIQQFTADFVSGQILAEGKGLKRSVVVETVFQKKKGDTIVVFRRLSLIMCLCG